jgi:N-acyl-L-homoserine lactone synthetase
LFYKTYFRDFDFYIQKTTSKSELEEEYKLRYQVYCEEYGYLDKEKFPDKMEHDEYDPVSDHFVMRDKNHEIAALVRVIRNSPLGFPLEKHFVPNIDISTIERSRLVEISRLIVAKKYRKQKLLLFLLKGLYHFAIHENVSHAYSIMDETLFPLLVKLKVPFKIIGEKSFYQGVTFPCVVVISEWVEEVKKSRMLENFFTFGGINEDEKSGKYIIH